MGEDQQADQPEPAPRERSEVRVSVRLTIAQARQLVSQIPPGTKTSSYVRAQLGLEGGGAADPKPEG